jgi:hypothetical protein
MITIRRAIQRLDQGQQNRRAAAFTFAVFKRQKPTRPVKDRVSRLTPHQARPMAEPERIGLGTYRRTTHE